MRTSPAFFTGRFYKRNDKDRTAYDDRRVRNIEGRPPFKRKESRHGDIWDIDIDKVDDAFGTHKPIDEISESSADDAADRPSLKLRKRIVFEVYGEHDADHDERKDREQKSSGSIGQAVADAESDARIRNVYETQYAAEKRCTYCKRRNRFYDNNTLLPCP